MGRLPYPSLYGDCCKMDVLRQSLFPLVTQQRGYAAVPPSADGEPLWGGRCPRHRGPARIAAQKAGLRPERKGEGTAGLSAQHAVGRRTGGAGPFCGIGAACASMSRDTDEEAETHADG